MWRVLRRSNQFSRKGTRLVRLFCASLGVGQTLLYSEAKYKLRPPSRHVTAFPHLRQCRCGWITTRTSTCYRIDYRCLLILPARSIRHLSDRTDDRVHYSRIMHAKFMRKGAIRMCLCALGKNTVIVVLYKLILLLTVLCWK